LSFVFLDIMSRHEHKTCNQDVDAQVWRLLVISRTAWLPEDSSLQTHVFKQNWPPQQHYLLKDALTLDLAGDFYLGNPPSGGPKLTQQLYDTKSG